MIADDKVTPLPSLLDRIGQRIDQAWQRTRKGSAEWIEGSLELAQALAEGRERFKADKAFGDWLVADRHDHVGDHARGALINLASDLTIARNVLTETKSRSYELIWRHNQDRFASVRKPDKPARGRRKGGGKQAPNPTRKVRNEKIVELANKGVPPKEIAAEVGLVTRGVHQLLEHDRIRAEAQAELFEIAAPENFTEKGKLRIEDAIRIHTVRLNKKFEQHVNEEVRKRIEAAADATRANNKKLHLENVGLQRMLSDRAVFTDAQYRQMLMLCHPDSSASPKLKAELLQVLIENKRRLVKQS